MKPARHWRRSSRWMRRGIGLMASLFLCLSASNLTGCALFLPPVHVIGVERCPTMSEEAIQSWADVFHLTSVEFRVWMGETILYCEKVEAMLK